MVVLARLAVGPLRLAFLDRPIAAAIATLAPELVAEIGATALVRSGRGVAFRVSDVRLATREGTTLLAFGGRPGQAWRVTPGEALREFFPLHEAKDFEGAAAVAREVLEDYPGNGLALYNLACCESLLGRADDAFEHLEAALGVAHSLAENAKTDDLEVNPMKAKQLTNFRASGGKDDAIRLTPPKRLTLEQAIAYIDDDEMVEVTPKSIRLRKRHLDPHERKKASRAKQAA